MRTIVSLIIIILGGASWSKAEGAKPLEDSHLKILTHNVWYGFTKVPDRKARWLDWMKSQDADVVFLQELNEYRAEMLEADAAVWGHPHTVLLKEEGFPTGLTSRYPLEDVRRTVEGFHHGLIRARVRDLYLYCIHLHPSNWEVRTREIRAIIADINSLPKDASILLAGDFNTFSSHDAGFYSHGRLEPFFSTRDREYQERNLKDGRLDYSALQTLMDRGFTDLEASMRTEPYTFTGTFPTRIEKPGDHGDRRRLDYVFSSPHLAPRVRRASVIADDTTWFLSDHLPVIVELDGD